MNLDEIECKMLSDLLADRFGLTFEGMRRDLLATRLTPRAQLQHCATFAEYYNFLMFHPAGGTELEQLKPLLTNNETYFFREHHQFEILARQVVPALAQVLKERPIRILSAGCSSGEEPYSIGLTLAEVGLGGGGAKWEIDACDLSPTRIAQARRAVYGSASMRAISEERKQRYFVENGDRQFVLRPPHRLGVRFFETNLVAPYTGLESGFYDAVFCRNVLIYFSEPAFHKAVSLFARALRPRGYLFLGHSESLIGRRADFEPLCLEGSIIYRRIGAPGP